MDHVLDAPKSQRRRGIRAADAPAVSFSSRTFDLLTALRDPDGARFYAGHRPDFRVHVEEPFRTVFRQALAGLPVEARDRLDMGHHAFGRARKAGEGGGAGTGRYRAGISLLGAGRQATPQLFASLDAKGLEFGFLLPKEAPQARDRLGRSLHARPESLQAVIHALGAGLLTAQDRIGSPVDGTSNTPSEFVDRWAAALAQPREFRVSIFMFKDDLLLTAASGLAARLADVFTRVFPLMEMASGQGEQTTQPVNGQAEPVPEPKPEPERRSRPHAPQRMPKTDGAPAALRVVRTDIAPAYAITQLAEETGLGQATLEHWVGAVERKGQAIIYGPTGTGKTYVAERLAQHLIAGSDGFWSILQFHPGYRYADFVQDVRAVPEPDGSLKLSTVPGRFLEFCERARQRHGRCVLIIDEINRADLPAVFGELLYMLEHRDRAFPLADGREFTIPRNVRLIGTMGTADPSRALSDQALRRRFAFLRLNPDYDILRRFHRGRGKDIEDLISVMGEVNARIGDPDAYLGVAFFLREDLPIQLEGIWKTEIEPYLETVFAEDPERVEDMRWERVKARLQHTGQIRWHMAPGVPQSLRGEVLVALRVAERYARQALNRWLDNQLLVAIYPDSTSAAAAYAEHVHVPLESVRAIPCAQAAPGAIFLTASCLRTAHQRMVRILGRAYFQYLYDVLAGRRDGTPVYGPAWLREGMAEFAAARSADHAGLVTFSDVQEDWIRTLSDAERRPGLADLAGPDLGPHIRDLGGSVVYACMALAVSFLSARCGGESKLVEYCEALRTLPWTEAFNYTFRVTPGAFVTAFEEWLAATLRSAAAAT